MQRSVQTEDTVYVRQLSSLTSFKRQINVLDLRKYLKGSATDIN